jgi:hypothetical protein
MRHYIFAIIDIHEQVSNILTHNPALLVVRQSLNDCTIDCESQMVGSKFWTWAEPIIAHVTTMWSFAQS